MREFNDISKRILRVYDLLLDKGLVRDIGDFSERLGYLPQTFYNIQKKKQNASVEFINSIVKEFNVSAGFLFTGKGSEFSTDDSADGIITVSVDSKGNENVLLVPYKAQAGYAKNFTNRKWLEKELDAISLPMLKGKYGLRGFEVEGDSMTVPSGHGIHNGDWLFATKVIRNPYEDIASQISQGRVYIVVTEDGLQAKRIYKEQGQDYYTLHSDNEYYQPFRLYEHEVKELWYCARHLDSHMPPPNNVDRIMVRMQDSMFKMESRLRIMEKVLTPDVVKKLTSPDVNL